MIGLLGRGLVRHRKKEYDKAIADYDEALRLDPNNAAVYYNRSVAWQFKDEFIKAVNDYDQAVRLDPRYARASQLRGPGVAGPGDLAPPPADAVASDPLAPAFAPRPAAGVDPAVVPAGGNDPFGNFGQNLQRDLAYADLCIQRAYIWVSAREYDKAIGEFDDAIRLNPHLAAAYVGRGHVRCEEKDFDAAIADYNKALEIAPRGLGPARPARAREFKGDHDGAFADFDEAARREPDSQMAHLGRAFGWQKKKEYAKAIAEYDEAIKLNPQVVAAYVGRAHARTQAKEYDQAVVDLDQAIALDRENAQAHNNLAWLRATCPEARVRDGKKAIESATRACELTEWKVARIDRHPGRGLCRDRRLRRRGEVAVPGQSALHATRGKSRRRAAAQALPGEEAVSRDEAVRMHFHELQARARFRDRMDSGREVEVEPVIGAGSRSDGAGVRPGPGNSSIRMLRKTERYVAFRVRRLWCVLPFLPDLRLGA